MLYNVNTFAISVQSDAKGMNTTGLMVTTLQLSALYAVLRVGGLEDEHAVRSWSFTLGRSRRLLVLRFLLVLIWMVCIHLFAVHCKNSVNKEEKTF